MTRLNPISPREDSYLTMKTCIFCIFQLVGSTLFTPDAFFTFEVRGIFTPAL